MWLSRGYLHHLLFLFAKFKAPQVLYLPFYCKSATLLFFPGKAKHRFWQAWQNGATQQASIGLLTIQLDSLPLLKPNACIQIVSRFFWFSKQPQSRHQVYRL